MAVEHVMLYNMVRTYQNMRALQNDVITKLNVIDLGIHFDNCVRLTIIKAFIGIKRTT
jgi:hypothetical protein